MKYLSIAALLVVQASFAMGDESAKELVEKAVARDEQVFSGRIKWIDGQDGPKVPPVLREEPDRPRFQSFHKDDWAEGGKCFIGGVDDWGHPIHASYNGRYVEYSPGWPDQARIDDARPTVDMEDHRTSINVKLPHWAGGFYCRKMKRWAKQFPDQFELVADDTIDGIAVKIVEAKVLDDAPFGKARPGGTIRLFIAPQLGYVIPRAEERTLWGTLAVRYEATDFSEKSPGIWFPTLIQEAVGDSKYYVKFLDVQMLNQEIPASDFVITIPKGVKPMKIGPSKRKIGP